MAARFCCVWSAPDSRPLRTSDPQPVSAKSGLVPVRQPNDWTAMTLPDAEPDDLNRPGPNQSSGHLGFDEYRR